MAIYRGAGGAGDAVADASSTALLVSQLAEEAQISADEAAASASAAASSETNASSSASGASTSATNAASSASSASTSASSASTSASTATTKASEASTSATNAASSATAAATSATNAASSASSASTSATNAASAQTAAESARDATLAAYDSFDDRYLGAKSSAPTVDNDGNALVGGTLYFDTVSQSMKLYTGSAWVDAYVPGGTYLVKTSNLSDITNRNAGMANLIGFTSTATAAGTTTLTSSSTYYQLFTGTTTQTVVLPVASTLQTGWSFHICNNSTGALTVNSSGGNLVISVLSGTTAMVTCILASGTTAASWEAGYTDFSTATGTGNVVLSTSPTLVTPILGTPTSGNLANCTFPTLNQSTTGSAATLTTARTIAITGDLTYTSPSFNGSANVTAAGTLATVNSNTGSFGSTTSIPVITVNGKGLITAVSTATISALPSQTGNSGKYLTTDGSAASWATVNFSPAGSTTQVQYNNAGSFGASSSFTYGSSTLTAPVMSASNGLVLNSATVSASYSIASGSNAMSVGPITVASGQSVTVPSGGRWVVL